MMRAAGAVDAADAAMLAVTLIWALSNVTSKTALAEISPLAFGWVWLVLVVPVLFGWVLLRERRLPVPAPSDGPLFLLTGVCGYGLYNALYIVGIDLTSAFSVALLLSLGPVFTLLFAAVGGIERVLPVQWAGVVVATAGVAIFVGDKLHGGFATNPVGDVLTLAAAACFGIYSLATRPLVAAYGAPATTAWSILIGLAVLTPVALGPTIRQPWAAVSASAWGGLLFATFGSLLVAYNLWAWAIQRRGIARTVPYLFLLPVLTGLFSALLVGERFGPRKLAGAVLVLGGTAVVRVIGGRLAAREARRAEGQTALTAAETA